VAIWAQVLNLAPDKIGVHDSFFALGGHSLLATQVISRVRTQLDIDLPLKAIFQHTKVSQLAELIAQRKKGAVSSIRPIDRTKLDRLPLSYAQERLWFLHQLDPRSAGYNVPAAAILHGELDINQVENAFNWIIARHENLRTLFPSREGQAQQLILKSVDFKLERIDLSHCQNKHEREAKAKEICRADAAAPFDLACGPLIRGKAIKLADDEHILLLNMHHIISDGWSMVVLMKELGLIIEALRQGKEPKFAPLPLQYLDYSVWQRNWLEDSGRLKRQLGYWQRKLAGIPENLEFATDYSRPRVRSHVGATYTFDLDAGQTKQLKSLSERQGGTLFMFLLASFKVLLYRYTGERDICIGSPIANRQYGETEDLIGMFVNTLVLRSRLDGEDSFATLLAQVKATCLEAYENQDTPFEKVADMLRPQRNGAISPLFQVMVTLQSAAAWHGNQRIQRYPLETGISKFDLIVEFTETPEGLTGLIEYSTELYKAQTIRRLAEHFLELCRAIVRAPNARICDLRYVGEQERERLLIGNNETGLEYERGRCIHELFEERVDRQPGKTAVVCGEEGQTYRQLNERSRDLALYLQSEGVKAGSLVAVCMERSLDMVVGVLGIVQAGGAYVPLDPDYPDERLGYMLQDSEAGVVLTQGKWEERLGSLVKPGTRLVVMDKQWSTVRQRVEELKARQVELRREAKGEDLVYVIYTSGSTGQPKGVMVEHRNLVNLVAWHERAFGMKESDVSTSMAGVGFDAAVWEMWPSLCVGGTLVLPTAEVQRDPETLLRWWEKQAVDVSFLSTPLAEYAFSRGISNGKLRVLLTGGDRLHRVGGQGEGFRLINNYGPTECTVVASSGELASGSEVLHIGRPIANTRIYILDGHGQPVPIGVAGEIYIGGAGVARGYWKRPELTAERFVTDPFSGEAGARMYKTSDQARWLEDGNIQYLGRSDTQVKIRGFRIELGEIEVRLNEHREIADSVVIVQGKEGEQRLVAFYRAKGTRGEEVVEVGGEELRGHLRRSMPEHMMPAAFVSLAAIPMTTNGKVDRRALSRMEVKIESGEAYVAPRSETENQLVAIWAQVLNLAPDKIGVHDSFFALGGHSLSAVRLMAKINARFNLSVPLAEIFTTPNIASLAQLVSNKEVKSINILVPIQPDGNELPIFGVPGAGGDVLSLRPLSMAFGTQQPFYGLQAAGLDGKTLPLNSVEETARTNIAALRTAQPLGPYTLLGHSYGGVIAYEMARMLLDQGEEIASLILLDSIAPSVMQATPAGDEINELFEACSTLTSLYDPNLKIDLGRLAQCSSEPSVEYFVSQLNDRGLEISTKQFTAFADVLRANLRCYRAYKPSILSHNIDVCLYRATQGHESQSTMPRDYGWNQLLPSPIRIYDVEANHFSILKEVHIQARSTQTSDCGDRTRAFEQTQYLWGESPCSPCGL
jgi:amino acid adenylation domain-containing protein